MLDLRELESAMHGKTCCTYYHFNQLTSIRGKVALRHDIDDQLKKSVRMAKWEHARGWSGTYFFLHTANYWDTTDNWNAMETIADLGHEIGLHYNALIECGGNWIGAAEMIDEALGKMRSRGHSVVGCAAHGDARRHQLGIGNEDFWNKFPLYDFALQYEAYKVQRHFGHSASDNGGHMPDWSQIEGGGTVTLHPQHWEV